MVMSIDFSNCYVKANPYFLLLVYILWESSGYWTNRSSRKYLKEMCFIVCKHCFLYLGEKIFIYFTVEETVIEHEHIINGTRLTVEKSRPTVSVSIRKISAFL